MTTTYTLWFTTYRLWLASKLAASQTPLLSSKIVCCAAGVAAGQQVRLLSSKRRCCLAKPFAAQPTPLQSPQLQAARTPRISARNRRLLTPRNALGGTIPGRKRVFAADVLACIRCGGRLRILTTIRTPEVTRKILEH